MKKMTVGMLRDLIRDIPDDAEVYLDNGYASHCDYVKYPVPRFRLFTRKVNG